LRGRLIRVSLIVAVVGGLLLAAVWALLRAEPSWYRLEPDPERVNQSANAFEDRIVEVVNWSAAIGAAELRGGRVPRSGVSTPGPEREWELRLRAEELTAFVRRWAVVSGFDQQIGRYGRDPVVVVEGGRIILGARPGGEAAVAGDAVVGLHLLPQYDSGKGELRLTLEKVTVGRLPLPAGWFDGTLSRAADQVKGELDRWNRDSRLDERGRSNTAMTRASGARLIEGLLRQQAVEAAGFVPMDERRGLAVRVTGLTVNDGELVVRLSVIPQEQRAGLGERVRGR
jgi:hypothetical protein